jgi:hypothetical protein
MDDQRIESDDRRHKWVAVTAVVASVVVLTTFRGLLELGFAPAGSRRFAGMPVEYPFLGWFIALWALIADRRRLIGIARLRATVYDWWLSVFGLAGLLWLATSLHRARLLWSTSWVYWFAGTCVLAVFVSSASLRRQGTGLRRGVLPDLLRIIGRPTTWACAIVAFAIAGAAPRSGEIPTGGRAFKRWYSRQRPENTPVGWHVAPVTLVELIDYQCPACRQAATRYKDVLHEATERYGSAFEFVRVDFPLENECNPLGGPKTGGLHPAGCESAAAVRLARQQSRSVEEQVIQWLWDHQRQLTREFVFDGVKRQFGLDLPQHYDELLPHIARDAAVGRALGVSGTPTFLLNGRRLPPIAPEALDAAIAIEIKAASSPGRTP